jgi:hypothetical protein
MMADTSVESADVGAAESSPLSIAYTWALPAAAAILVLPLWIAHLPAMPDFPAHLAGFHIIASGGKLAAKFYRLQWTWLPNMASELVVPALGKVVPILVATKLFLSVGVLMWALAAGAIHKALYGRVGASPLAASVFTYNANFMWGFFNYFFGMGLALLVFAGWIASEGRRESFRLPAVAALTTIIYFCHLFAFATFLVMIICYELAALWKEQPSTAARILARGLRIAAIALPGVLAFVFLKPAGAGSDHLEFNLLSTLDDRASAAIQFAFDRPAYPVFIGLFLFFTVGVWRRNILIHPRMTLLLVLLAMAAMFTPEWAMGGWGVDLRLPAVLGVLAFAASDLEFKERTVQVFVALIMTVVAYQSATVAGNWRYYDRQIAEFRAAIAHLPADSRLMTVLDGDAMGMASDQPYWHLAEYGIIDRSDFTPLMFTTKGQHVVQLRPAVSHIAAQTAEQGSPPDISDLDDLEVGNVRDDPDIAKVFPYLIRFQCHFDYAVVIHAGGKQTPPPDMLERVHAGSFFSLYRIVPSEDCERP